MGHWGPGPMANDYVLDWRAKWEYKGGREEPLPESKWIPMVEVVDIANALEEGERDIIRGAAYVAARSEKLEPIRPRLIEFLSKLLVDEEWLGGWNSPEEAAQELRDQIQELSVGKGMKVFQLTVNIKKTFRFMAMDKKDAKAKIMLRHLGKMLNKCEAVDEKVTRETLTEIRRRKS